MELQPSSSTPQHSRGNTWLAVVVVLALVAGVILYLGVRKPIPAGNDGSASVEPAADPASEESPAVPAPLPPAARRVPAASQPAGARASRSNASPHVSAAPLPAASLPSQQIIERLAKFDPRQAAITSEQGAELRNHLQQLLSQGAAALPAIQQFLDKNEDLTFDDTGGSNQVGYSSLRSALFEVAKQIGGPASTELFLNTLQNTADPTEMASMARYLEEQAPGQYKQEVVTAARETLDQAAAGQLQVKDAGPLFQLLQSYGDATTAAELANTTPQWQYYAAMALANMNDGVGVTALVQSAKEAAASGKNANPFTLQMLAQVAGHQPEAASTLVEQARQNQIPDRSWTKIVEGIAGDQYQMGKPPADPSNPGVPVSGLKTYHIESGNQNFYSLPFNLYGSPEQAAQRLAVVDQLLAATQNPAAIQALKNAREVLSAPPAR